MTPKLIDQVREAQDIYAGPSRNSRTYGLQRMLALAPAMAARILATEERLSNLQTELEVCEAQRNRAMADAAKMNERLRAEVAMLREKLNKLRLAPMLEDAFDGEWGCEETVEILCEVDAVLTSTAPTASAHDRRVRNEALEEAAKVYEDFMSVAGPSSLDDRLCCDGRECSCYGATERDQLLYYGRAAIRSLIQEGE